MKRIQLLLADDVNAYQRLLLEQARSAAEARGMQLLEPRSANGSIMQQIGHCYESLRTEPRPDGLLLLLVAPDEMESSVSAVAAAGVACVLLNRIPGYLPRLRALHPNTLLASVTPDQTEIGRIQGRQARRMLPQGGSLLLVRGAAGTPSTSEREAGLREVVGDAFEIQTIDGLWQEARAQRALEAWLRFGGARSRSLALVVSQNDSMARGARQALRDHAAKVGAPELANVPMLGCDGLPGEGVEMVRSAELAATVVMPPTSARAVEILDAYWRRGTAAAAETLLPDSLPPVQELRARS